MRRPVLVLATLSLTFAGCSEGRVQLPLSAIADSRAAATVTHQDALRANLRYDLSDSAAAAPDYGNAYKFTRATKDDAVRLAKAFGIAGAVRQDKWGFVVGKESERNALRVGFDGEFFGRGGSRVVGPVPPSCDDTEVGVSFFDASAASCAAPNTTTTIAPALRQAIPGAKRIALAAVQRAGLELPNPKVTTGTYDGYVVVSFAPPGGAALAGYPYDATVSVDAEGRIGAVSGYLTNRKSIGTFELATPQHALDRLIPSRGVYQGTTDDVSNVVVRSQNPGGEPGPFVVKLVRVRVGLMVTTVNARTRWLVPAYVFDTAPHANGQVGHLVAPAVSDRYLPPGR